MKLHPVLKLVTILYMLYFGLVWLKVLPHPAWLPAEIEPLTFITGLGLAIFAWWEEIVETIKSQLPQTEPKYLARPPAQLTAGALGRVRALKKLRQKLHFARSPVVVFGIGGLGKTTFAQMFWREQKTRYDHVAWLPAVAVFSAEAERQAENAEYFLRAFTDNVELKNQLALKFDPQERPVEHFRLVLTALACVRGRNLLVVDNVPEAAAQYAEELSKLPENWKILLTSRHAIPNMEAFELEALSPEEAARVFWNVYSEGLTPGQPLTTPRPNPDPLLRAIGYHTLTVELLAAYAREKKLDIPGLHKEVEARGLARLDGYNLTVKKSGKNQPLHAPLRDTFLLDLSDAEKELMRCFCILPPDGSAAAAEWLSEDFLCDLLGKQADKVDFHNCLHDLGRLHWLVQRDGRYACHPVIADTAKAQLLPDVENCAILIKNVTNLLIPDEKTNEPVIACAPFAPLGEAVFKGVWKENGDFIEADDAVAGLALWLNWLFRDLGEFYKALDYGQKMVDIRERVLPAEHSDLATSYNNLAGTYGALGEHQKALECNQKALAILEKVLPAEHPDLATSYNNLAATYHSLGDLEQCLQYSEKALTIREKVLPAEHPDWAQSYNNLAGTYDALGEHQKALEYNQKALAIWEKVLPAEHPDLALSYNNLAATYHSLGDLEQCLQYLEKALAILEKALAILEKVLPAEHPDLATFYNNLGWTYHDLGDLDKACNYMSRALAIREKSLPPAHPSIQNARDALKTFEAKRQERG